MSTCIFCDIIEKKSPASIVYEDEIVLAFLDINPVTKGHLLVIPKKHFRIFTDLDETTASHLFEITLKLSKAIRESDLNCEGLNLFLAEEQIAMQKVFHAHIHLIPRYHNDGFGIKANFTMYPLRKELNTIASQIKKQKI
ncbi:HIT domain-containing protein [Candidatus Dependentiae bacterium]|nr:HIT domain-containing protein [Candidatus Dependentiae bacterium]